MSAYLRDKMDAAHRREVMDRVKVKRNGEVYLPLGMLEYGEFIGTVSKDHLLFRASGPAGEDLGLCGYRAEAVEQLLKSKMGVK